MADYGFEQKIAHSSGDDKSPSRKHLGEYYFKLGQWCDQAYEEAVAIQRDIREIKDIQATLDYLVGLQWKLEMPSYKARPVSSEMLDNFWETIGLLTDIRPVFHVKELGSEYSHVEKILNQLVAGWSKTIGFNRKIAFWTMFGMLTSAPMKVFWNPFARGDSGDFADGDLDIEVLPASSLLRLGTGGTYQDDELLIYERVRTLNWIRRAYPTMGKYVTPDETRSKYTVDIQAPATVSPHLFQTMNAGMKMLMGGTDKSMSTSVFPKATVREYWMKDDTVNESRNDIWMGPENAPWGYWVKPGQKLYPRGRLVVRSNKVTLYDEPNPYYHRKKPFVELALYGVPWQDYALSVMKPWTTQVDIMNQIMAGVLNSVKKALNPALMAPKSAIHPDSLRQIDSSKPGLKVSYNSNAATAPQWARPPEVPGYVFNAYEIAKKAMRRTSAGDAMDSAMSKKQVPGGDTLDRINFSKTTPIRYMGGTVEDSMSEVGNMWVSGSLQFHTAERRMEVLGASGLTKEDIDDRPGSLIPDGVKSEDYVRRFHFSCEKGSFLNIEHQERLPVALALRKGRDLSRPQLFRMLNWNINTKQNDEELAEESKQAAMAMAAAGVKPGAGGHGHK